MPRKQTEITDPATIEVICRIQQQFVQRWNTLELAGDLEAQTHDLPAGASYSADGPVRGFRFLLPGDARLLVHAKPPWRHWHDGLSFCRHSITPEQVRKVVVQGPATAFYDWLQEANPSG